MAFTRRVEFANFTLTFGENEVLLDYFDEIVFPIFHEGRFKRTLNNETEYFFLDTRLVKLEGTKKSPVVGITGRFVESVPLSV